MATQFCQVGKFLLRCCKLNLKELSSNNEGRRRGYFESCQVEQLHLFKMKWQYKEKLTELIVSIV
jgi:hypothetical protein